MRANFDWAERNGNSSTEDISVGVWNNQMKSV